MAARNIQRIEINIHEKLCVKLVIYNHSEYNLTVFVRLLYLFLINGGNMRFTLTLDTVSEDF